MRVGQVCFGQYKTMLRDGMVLFGIGIIEKEFTMAAQKQNRLLLIIAVLSFSQLIDCGTYKKLSAEYGDRRTKNQAETKLVRMKLSKSDKLDSFEDFSRSRNSFQDEDMETRPPFGLNSQLIGLVEIGTPAQKFRLIFDTTYANVWIPTLECVNCGNKRRYNSSASSTYIKDGREIFLGWGHIGFRSIDQIAFGGATIKNLTFAEMLKIDDRFVSTPYDGLFCLAFDWDAQEDVVTPLRQMLDQGLIEHEIFSIYQNATGGEIIFGGYDEDHMKGFVSWVPSLDLINWAFQMDRMTLRKSSISDQVTVCSNGCEVRIYTYLPYIRGPPNEVMLINQAIGAEVDEDDDSLFVLPNCDLSKLPNLALQIYSTDFELTPEQYVQKVQKGGQIICVSTLRAVQLPSPTGYHIGSSVIGNIYTIFDSEHRALGFAHTK